MVVCPKLVGIQRRFLWEGSNDINKLAWVKWNDICQSKNGGLGVKNIELFSEILLEKWK